MSWTAPRTWVDEEVVDATDMNSDLRDNMRFLKGLDGNITLDDDLILTDQVASTDIRLRVENGILQLRDDGDTTDQTIAFTSCPTGVGATDLSIGNHSHPVTVTEIDLSFQSTISLTYVTVSSGTLGAGNLSMFMWWMASWSTNVANTSYVRFLYKAVQQAEVSGTGLGAGLPPGYTHGNVLSGLTASDAWEFQQKGTNASHNSICAVGARKFGFGTT